MARKISIRVNTNYNTVFLYDYDDQTNIPNSPYVGGLGGFSLQNITTIELDNPACSVSLRHVSGFQTGVFNVSEIEIIDINGDTPSFTTIDGVVEIIGPYLFQGSGGGYTYSLTRTLTASEILNDLSSGSGSGAGIELLPAVADKCYDFKVYCTLNAVTTDYANGGNLLFQYGGNSVASLSSGFLTGTPIRKAVVQYSTILQVAQGVDAGNALCIYSAGGIPYIDGDHTFTLEIHYNIF